jgi:predicted ATPase
MSNRRLIVETHSDHLVRRLRGLVARAGQGSELEKWLLENVVVLSVEQDAEGRSSVTSSRLTADGSVGEVWPADFMDEATDEESAIYYAKLDKAETREAPRVELIDGEEPELNEAP